MAAMMSHMIVGTHESATRDALRSNSNRSTRVCLPLARWPPALAMLALGLACASEPEPRARISAPSGRRGESTAQRLHRHGVNCMDELEREDCAVRNFRELLALNPSERDLVGDATFRLIRIYKRRGDQESVTELTRQYWDLGMEKQNIGVLPHTAHYFPREVSILSSFDLERFHASPLGRSLSKDSRDWLFTCDDARRERLSEARRKRQEERREERRKANGDAEPSQDARADKSREDKRHAQREKRKPPVYEDGHCQLARALGQNDLTGWKRTVNGHNHDDTSISVSLITVDGADDLLTQAQLAGRIQATDDGLFTLSNVEYADGPVGVATLDAGELALAPLPLLRDLRDELDAREETLSTEITKFTERMPDDASMFVVLSREAMLDGFSEGGPLTHLMPSPEGLLVGVVLHRYSGVFVRMPTNDPLKMQLMLPILYRMMQVNDGDTSSSLMDSDTFGDVDLAPSADGKALIFSAVLTVDQTRRLIDGEI